MVDAANTTSTNLDILNFLVADCSVPMQYQDAPFDVVFGAWLLNYASSGKEMSDMFRNASVNLTEKGHFIGVTPPPTDEPRGHGERALAARPTHCGDVVVTVIKDVEDGVATHLDATMKTGKIEFDAYHLRKSVYERSAWEGGLEGTLNWRPLDSPDINGGVLENLRSSAWDSHLTVPHFSVLVVAKT